MGGGTTGRFNLLLLSSPTRLGSQNARTRCGDRKMIYVPSCRSHPLGTAAAASGNAEPAADWLPSG